MPIINQHHQSRFSRSDVLKNRRKSLAVLAIDNENRKVAYYFYDKGKKNEALKMYNKVEDESKMLIC